MLLGLNTGLFSTLFDFVIFELVQALVNKRLRKIKNVQWTLFMLGSNETQQAKWQCGRVDVGIEKATVLKVAVINGGRVYAIFEL